MGKRRKRVRRSRKDSLEEQLLFVVAAAITVLLFATQIRSGHISFLAVLPQTLLLLGMATLTCLTVWLAYRLFSKQLRIARNQKEFHRFQLVSETDGMNSYKFEELVGYVLEHNGCTHVEVTKQSADGGIDIYLRKNGKRVAVQVKHYKVGNNVDVKEARELVGASINNFQERWIVTSSDFTGPAKAYAMFIPSLKLINREELGRLMENLPDKEHWMARFI